MRERLEEELAIPSPRCLCGRMGERARCMEGFDAIDYRDVKLAELKSHYPGYGATFLFACRECAQRWCMFGDDDDWFFLRLTREEGTAILERDTWPRIFLGWIELKRHCWVKQQQRQLSYPGAEAFAESS